MTNTPFSLIAVFNDENEGFLGNTAAVVLLQDARTDAEMQALAAEFNQPATTFLWPFEGRNAFHTRWFAPDGEIGLCGHGSLAAIAFLADKFNTNDTLELQYREGILQVQRTGSGQCSLTLAAIPVISEEPIPDVVPKALGIPVIGYFTTSNKHIVLVKNEQDVKKMTPDFGILRQSDTFAYAVTAPGDKVDFVSRTLVPHVRQLEDPATGSSHAALVPFWAEKLKKTKLNAHQLSARGGKFICEIENEQVSLLGDYKIIAEGTLR